MRLSLGLCFLFLLLQLQPPAPTPGETRHEKQQTTTAEQTETNLQKEATEPPFIANSQLITRQDPSRASQPQQKSSTDWWLTCFTGALVIVAVLQFIAMHRQAEYMRKGLRISIKATRAARQSARAALLSANALIDSERAWFDLDVVRAEPRRWGLYVTNYGHTHGIVTGSALTYAKVMPEKVDEIVDKIRDGQEWDSLCVMRSKTSEDRYHILLPRKPTELTVFDPASFVGTRDVKIHDLFFFRVEYETLGQDCWTEVGYFAQQLPGEEIRMVEAPIFTRYE